MKLGSKLVVQTVLPAVIAVSVLLAIVSQVASTALQSAAEHALAAVADARREELRSYLARMEDDIRTMGDAPAVIQALGDFSAAFVACGGSADTDLQQLFDGSGALSTADRGQGLRRAPGSACRNRYGQVHADHDAFFRKRHTSYGWYDMLLVDLEGNVVYSVRNENDFATNLLTGPWKETGLARAAAIALRHPVNGVPAFADAARYAPSGNRPGMFLAIPVLESGSGRQLGALAVQIAFEPLDRQMHFKDGLGKTGEAFLVGTGGWLLTNTFFDPDFSTFNRQLTTVAVKRVLDGAEGSDRLVDYRNQESFIAYRPLTPFAGSLGDQPTWGVIAKISRAEALASLYSLQWLMLGSGVLISCAAIVFGFVASRRLFSPVRAMQSTLVRLAGGEKVPIPGLARDDEIGDMAKAADTFREMSDGVARDRWIREQVATLTTAVSQEPRLARIPDIILTFLRRQLDIPVGSFFLRDPGGNYQQASTQGLARSAHDRDSFGPGESLIGQCARDGQTVTLSPVPAGLGLIATGLVEFSPEQLVLYPIAHQQETLAVVELAATRTLTSDERALLAALAVPLGLHLANAVAAERNLALLGESREQAEVLSRQKTELDLRNTEMKALTDEMRGQAEELKAQNEEFRTNQEELRSQQEELAHKNRALEAQGRQLEFGREEAEARARELAQSNQYKSQFLANMSHELRTPLNSILILARHLSENTEGRLDADDVESATVIHESGSQLLSLINDILDLSRIEAGKLEMLAEDFSVSDMLLYLRRLFEPLAHKKSIEFTIESGAGDPGTLCSDRRYLTQVLTNLLSNAVKFTDEGAVRLAVREEGDGMVFDVIDSGIGIPADQIEHIFGAFQQVDGGTARKYGGSGLGLAISRQLVALLGCRLEVDSTPGTGSRFSLYVPKVPRTRDAAAAPPDAPPPDAPLPDAPLPDAPPPDAPPPDAPLPPAITGARTPGDRLGMLILVVEDDGRLLPIVTRLIEALGYLVRAVESGEKALELIATERPAGVLLDLGLPGISGMEVLRRMKSDPATASIPVYIMSGAADTGEAETLGALGYIRKPITRDAVLAAIRRMIGHSSAPAATDSPTAAAQVLLVEDDEAGSLAVRRLFQNLPIELARARDGAEGLAALASSRFDAIILDLTLPDMSGFEWLERVAAEMPRHPPVVVYSARDLDNAELLRLRAHADAVISKGRLNGQTSVRLREELLFALAQKRRQASPATPAPAAVAGSLLIVDDDVRNQAALSKVLRARGFDVGVAASGAQALEMLAAGRYDAVLTDIMMPEMDGFEFIRRLRGSVAGALPIIAVTAKAMPGDIELCLAAGATDYLAKPVDIDRLLALLEKWL